MLGERGCLKGSSEFALLPLWRGAGLIWLSKDQQVTGQPATEKWTMARVCAPTSPVRRPHAHRDLYVGFVRAGVVHVRTWPGTNEWIDLNPPIKQIKAKKETFYVNAPSCTRELSGYLRAENQALDTRQKKKQIKISSGVINCYITWLSSHLQGTIFRRGRARANEQQSEPTVSNAARYLFPCPPPRGTFKKSPSRARDASKWKANTSGPDETKIKRW